ncbi:MAG TPA: hypothetical protein VJT09_07915 [Pyrinomonadaceae bacterium]|nr:hypothetical protein [Pyrinomonadaceae bacterium]
MKRRNLIALALALTFACGGAAAAQGGLRSLRSWAGKYPTDRRGKVARNFFRVPAVRRPLLGLLSRQDFNLLTRTYGVETPIKLIGDFLAVKVCRPHSCDTDQAGFAINLRTGFVYVRMQEGQTVRWFSTRDTYTELPQNVQEYLTDFAAT